MCECNMMSEGVFTPITINDNELSFNYFDRQGKNHILIEKFSINMTITKAQLFETKDENGNIIGYQFHLT